MRIIDSKKDYYDYLQGIIGIDDKVTYDRRGSNVICESGLLVPYGYNVFLSDKIFDWDKPKEQKYAFQSRKYEKRLLNRNWNKKNYIKIDEGEIHDLILEVGYHQFIFEMERYLDKDGKLHKDISIVDIKKVDKKGRFSDAPLYIAILHENLRTHLDQVKNPILRETWIPSFIPPMDIWNMLYEYISSLNDKEFVDSRTNEQHIESNGFDKKISFRHRK